MSEAFDRYVAWLDFSGHEQALGYYGLLRLKLYESDSDKIEQALFQESLGVSSFLRGPQRELAEAVLEEINRAESCLMSSESKATYDALLRASSLVIDKPAVKCPQQREQDREEEPVRLVDVDAKPRQIEAPQPDWRPAATVKPSQQHSEAAHAVEAHRVASPVQRPTEKRSPSPNDVSAIADRSIWAAVESSRRRPETKKAASAIHPAPQASHGAPAAATGGDNPPQTEDLTTTQSAAHRRSTEKLSFSTALAQLLLAQIPAPLVKHRWAVLAGSVALVGMVIILQGTISRFNRPRTRPPRIKLDANEELLVTQQITVLYDVEQDAATRTAAAEKLRTVSPDAVRRFSYRIGDVAERTPEESIQLTLQSILQSAGIDH